MKRIMSKEEFLSVYERQQASGLTIKDFCENESYSSSCFHYWKKKFGLSRTYTSHPDKLPDDTFIPLDLHRRGNLPSGSGGDVTIQDQSLLKAQRIQPFFEGLFDYFLTYPILLDTNDDLSSMRN